MSGDHLHAFRIGRASQGKARKGGQQTEDTIAIPGRRRARDRSVPVPSAPLTGEARWIAEMEAAERAEREAEAARRVSPAELEKLPGERGQRQQPTRPLAEVKTMEDFRTWAIENEDTAEGAEIFSERLDLVHYDDSWRMQINPEGVRTSARAFVKESMDIRYSREYVVDAISEHAEREGGVRFADRTERENFVNAVYMRRARVILKAAELGRVRLTEAQRRRLRRATEGEYLDMVYERRGSEIGSLRRAVRRRRPQRLAGVELEQARANFREWTGVGQLRRRSAA